MQTLTVCVPEVSVIIVNYRSRKDLSRCLASLECESVSCEIIVVNNDKDTLSLPVRLGKNPLRLFELGKNVGFGAACNFAAKMASGRSLFFLNPDAELKRGCLEKLISECKRTGAEIAGPCLVDKSGKCDMLSSGLGLSILRLVFRKNFSKRGGGARFVEWISGAALLTDSSLFRTLEGFDEDIFLYFEDTDYCLRARALGIRVLFVGDAATIHKGGCSKIDWRERIAYYDKSQDIIFLKHKGFFCYSALRSLRFFWRFFKTR